MVAKQFNIKRTDINPEYKLHQKFRDENYSLIRKSIYKEPLTDEEKEIVKKADKFVSVFIHSDDEYNQIQNELISAFQSGKPIFSPVDWVSVEVIDLIGEGNEVITIEKTSSYWDGLNDEFINFSWLNKASGKIIEEARAIGYDSCYYKLNEKYINHMYYITVDASEETKKIYEKHLQTKEIERNIRLRESEENRAKNEYYNLNLGLNVAVQSNRGKNPFEKGAVGNQVYTGDSQYGPYIILRFANAGSRDTKDGNSVLSPLSKWKPYVPSCEVTVEAGCEYVTDTYGFLGKFFAQLVFNKLFAKDGLDLRNYPIEVFDKAICEGLEHLSTHATIIDFFRTQWLENSIRSFDLFYKHVYTQYKDIFNDIIQIVDNALQENLEEFNNGKKNEVIEEEKPKKRKEKVVKEKPVKEKAAPKQKTSRQIIIIQR